MSRFESARCDQCAETRPTADAKANGWLVVKALAYPLADAENPPKAADEPIAVEVCSLSCAVEWFNRHVAMPAIPPRARS